MMISAEFLYMQCNLRKHALELTLMHPVRVEDEAVSDLTALKVSGTDEYYRYLLTNIANGINTNDGKITLEVSDLSGNPLNPIMVSVDLRAIKSYEFA